VRPPFFARSNQGELEEVQGKPDLIVEWQGKVKVRLKQAQQPQYLDLLALESELLGEHPSHKIFRLRAMGIPIADDLERKLRSSSSAHRLFHTLDFEYLPGKETRGIIAEIFPDGTFLVIPFGVPEEWRSPSGEERPYRRWGWAATQGRPYRGRNIIPQPDGALAAEPYSLGVL
jgi:hypothetical protein